MDSTDCMNIEQCFSSVAALTSPVWENRLADVNAPRHHTYASSLRAPFLSPLFLPHPHLFKPASHCAPHKAPFVCPLCLFLFFFWCAITFAVIDIWLRGCRGILALSPPDLSFVAFGHSTATGRLGPVAAAINTNLLINPLWLVSGRPATE